MEQVTVSLSFPYSQVVGENWIETSFPRTVERNADSRSLLWPRTVRVRSQDPTTIEHAEWLLDDCKRDEQKYLAKGTQEAQRRETTVEASFFGLREFVPSFLLPLQV